MAKSNEAITSVYTRSADAAGETHYVRRLRVSLWEELHNLFDQDDGSLPDIFLEGLTDQEIEAVYLWVRSLTEIYGEPTLWSIAEEKNIPIRSIENPVKMFLQGWGRRFGFLISRPFRGSSKIRLRFNAKFTNCRIVTESLCTVLSS